MAGNNPRYHSMLRLFVLLVLVASTAAFDLLAIWAVGFTISWGGGIPFGSTGTVGFWALIFSPVVVTGCAAYAIRAILREPRHQS